MDNDPFNLHEVMKDMLALLLGQQPEDPQTVQWKDNFMLHEMKIGPVEFDEKGKIVA